VTISAAAGRVLGCLVEKERTTPQQYPLTLNALTLACNQATNRDPVVTLDDDEVLVAVDVLRQQRLVRVVLPSHGRSVKRYRHVMDEIFSIDTRGAALMALLMLRGPQTPGELRARVERMADMPTVADVQTQLDLLAHHPDRLVSLLPRRPGQKEDRWQQLLAEPWGPGSGPDGSTAGGGPGTAEGPSWGHGDVGSETSGDEGPTEAVPAESSATGAAEPARRGEVEALKVEVASLRTSLDELRADLDELRRSLGD
jgi:uncharacterized protein YceH (UPF0502 family)